MQTATVLTSWKPLQRNRDDATMEEIMWHCRETRQSTENTNIVLKSRHGKIPEGLSGSLAPGMLEEKRRELGRPHWLPEAKVRYAVIETRTGKPRNGIRPKPGARLPGKRYRPRREERRKRMGSQTGS